MKREFDDSFEQVADYKLMKKIHQVARGRHVLSTRTGGNGGGGGGGVRLCDSRASFCRMAARARPMPWEYCTPRATQNESASSRAREAFCNLLDRDHELDVMPQICHPCASIQSSNALNARAPY